MPPQTPRIPFATLLVLFSFLVQQKLSPRKSREGAGAPARTSAAGLGTYEMILGAALAASRFEAVLAQADAARAALRDASSSSSSSSEYDHGASRGDFFADEEGVHVVSLFV